MQVLHRCCCGLDVHKDSIVACVRRVSDDAGGEASHGEEQVRAFSATTAGILLLGDWLAQERVTIAAMESVQFSTLPVKIVSCFFHSLCLPARWRWNAFNFPAIESLSNSGMI